MANIINYHIIQNSNADNIKDNKGEDGRRKEEDTIKKGVKMVLS